MAPAQEINLNAFRERAKAGDANAQYEMAFLENEYTDPIVDDGKRSLAWLEKAANQGHSDAQLTLGLYYLFKTERELLKKRWRNYLNQNINGAPLCLAVSLVIATLFKANNDKLAFEWLKKSSDHSNAEGQFWLGYCYYNGLGIEQNHEAAFAEFSKAAMQNMPDAMYWLALCYFEGNGVLNNDSLAFDWLMKAVENECDDAYLMLGDLYQQGKYVEQDAMAAFQCYEKASIRNNGLAQHKLAQLYMHGEGVAKDLNKAFEWEEEAAENGNPEAKELQINLFLGTGIGLVTGKHDGKKFEINLELAFKYFQKAASYGSVTAYCLIADCYERGKGVEQSKKLAFEYYQKVLNSEQYELLPEYIKSMAHYAISRYYREGNIFEKDEILAERHLTSVNKEVLGDIIVDGLINFPTDLPEAKEILPARVNILNAMGKYDDAREFVNGVLIMDDESEKNYKETFHALINARQDLARKNSQLEAEINEKRLLENKMQKLVEQYTHTLGNVIFPDTIFQVAERLKTNPDCRKDVLLLNEAYHSEIIIKLQAELLRQRYANSNPEKFRQLIRTCRRNSNSQDKTKSITDILDYAASRVAARFLNQHNSSLGSIRDKILAQKNASLDALRQQFEDDILLNRTLGSVEWINQHLRSFEVTALSPLWQKVCILAESHAEALLFGYFSEVLFNAFKYADHNAEKFLTVRFDEAVIDGKTYLCCSWSNPQGNKIPGSLGTGKGLDAILEDLQQLNDTGSDTKSLLVSQNDQQFQVTMYFQKDLLINDEPILKMPR